MQAEPSPALNSHTKPAPLEAELKRTVINLVREESAQKMSIKVGWYTERAMKETLKMSKCLAQPFFFF